MLNQSVQIKTFPAYGNEKIISLADIAMYTDDAEVPLYDVLEAMKKKKILQSPPLTLKSYSGAVTRVFRGGIA